MLIMSEIGRKCNNRAFFLLKRKKKKTELCLISVVLGKQKGQLRTLLQVQFSSCKCVSIPEAYVTSLLHFKLFCSLKNIRMQIQQCHGQLLNQNPSENSEYNCLRVNTSAVQNNSSYCWCY